MNLSHRIIGMMYLIVTMLLMLGGLTLNDFQHEWGLYLTLASVLLMAGVPWVSKKYGYQYPKEEITGTTEDIDIGPSSAFVYPWALSFFISFTTNYFLIEKVFPYVLLGCEIFISALLSYAFLIRLMPELSKRSNRYVVILVIVPISSVVVALIFSQFLITL